MQRESNDYLVLTDGSTINVNVDAIRSSRPTTEASGIFDAYVYSAATVFDSSVLGGYDNDDMVAQEDAIPFDQEGIMQAMPVQEEPVFRTTSLPCPECKCRECKCHECGCNDPMHTHGKTSQFVPALTAATTSFANSTSSFVNAASNSVTNSGQALVASTNKTLSDVAHAEVSLGDDLTQVIAPSLSHGCDEAQLASATLNVQSGSDYAYETM